VRRFGKKTNIKFSAASNRQSGDRRLFETDGRERWSLGCEVCEGLLRKTTFVTFATDLFCATECATPRSRRRKIVRPLHTKEKKPLEKKLPFLKLGEYRTYIHTMKEAAKVFFKGPLKVIRKKGYLFFACMYGRGKKFHFLNHSV
jgi:hypothetical protein